MDSTSLPTRQAGTFDESFADGGVFLLNTQEAGLNRIMGVMATSSHLYFCGSSTLNPLNSRYLLGRMWPDGSLDDTFGANGIVRASFGGTQESTSRSIAICSDGKLLLTGSVAYRSPALARYYPDGRLDRSFGTAGHVILPLPEEIDEQVALDIQGESQDSACTVTPLADGKILVVRNYVITHGADTRAFVFLLNSDGSLDTTFNQKGYVQVLYPGATPADVGLASGSTDSNGRIMVCGRLMLSDESTYTPLLARYTRDGRLDTSFGEKGFVVYSDAPRLKAGLVAVIGQPNNRLLGIGITEDGEQGVLVSLEPDGSANIQFNRGQPLLTRLDNTTTRWKGGVMQADGKIVLAGQIKHPDQRSEAVVVRLLSDGLLDSTFNNVGWASTPVLKTPLTHAVVLQADGKIVVAGETGTTRNTQGFLLRFHASN
ncbi:hypothetical protein [Pseudomonas sp. NPDC087817]|uniref:hypothetical protein n=1 Tax=Pseudomonas sp. NPDC087817 TaxID=3364451 RepID=UPI00381025D5